MYDIAIIGAGITGACIAREFSKYNAKIVLLEKENDVSCGCSKANSGIVHAGYDPLPDTLMARLNIRGAELYPELAKDLNFDYKNIGSIVTATDFDGEKKLDELLERGKKNGVQKMEIIDREELLELEPNIADCVTKALLVPTGSIVNPYQATWAIAENAVMNGVEFFRNATVFGIRKMNAAGEVICGNSLADGQSGAAQSDSDFFELETGAGKIQAKFVVNAAGLGADKISEMAGARKFKILQRRGEYCLLDSNCSSLVNHTIFQVPTKMGKGVLVTPTVDGNILIGPSADDLEGDELFSTDTTAEAQSKILKQALQTVNVIPSGNIINSFSGIREIAMVEFAPNSAKNGENVLQNEGNSNPDGQTGECEFVPLNDFLIEEDAKVKRFINVAGISSPGLSAGPAIGEFVTQIAQKAGFSGKMKDNFLNFRSGIESFKNASMPEKIALIKQNPLYGQIICRCEMITEAEIVQAIHCPIGALDLDGIKRRTRAGMGRCQSGFCSPRVTEILSRETGIPMTSVTKKGKASFVLAEKSRDF